MPRRFLQDQILFLNPPVLVPPIPGQPLILYLAVQEESMGCMLGQCDGLGKKERAIYYLSKKILDYEVKYTPLEKTCVSLVSATQRLRHYFLSHRVILISIMDPIKYLLEKPATTGRAARWLIMLSEFDITYVTQKSIKDQAVADYLACNPLEENIPMCYDFPDKEVLCVEAESMKCDQWKMYFDGASNQVGNGIRAVLISPTEEHIPIAISYGLNVPTTQRNMKRVSLGSERQRIWASKNWKCMGIPQSSFTKLVGYGLSKNQGFAPTMHA